MIVFLRINKTKRKYKRFFPLNIRDKSFFLCVKFAFLIVLCYYKQQFKRGIYFMEKFSYNTFLSQIQRLSCSGVQQLLKKYRLSAYEEDKRKGIFRHVLIKKGFATNQIMVVLVTSVNSFPNRKEIVKDLLKAFPNIKTIVQNINSRDTNVVLGEKENILFGTGYIEDILLGVKFKISSIQYKLQHCIQKQLN